MFYRKPKDWPWVDLGHPFGFSALMFAPFSRFTRIPSGARMPS
jgi:hypothetical protein